jgi:hypothetical protein
MPDLPLSQDIDVPRRVPEFLKDEAVEMEYRKTWKKCASLPIGRCFYEGVPSTEDE